MIKLIELVLLGGMLSGCAAFTSPQESTSPYRPADSISHATTGVVVYNPHGIEVLVKQRREDAYRKMYDFCGGSNKYKILSEEDVAIEEVSYVSNFMASIGASKMRRIEFQCL